MSNKPDDEADVDTASQPQDGQQLVDRLEHQLEQNPDPELVERIHRSPVLKAMVISEMHQGPLPPAQAMADYERVLPGAAERILLMAEREQSQRHETQKEQLNQNKQMVASYMKQDTLGKWMGFIIAMSVLILACVMALLGHEGLAVVLAGLDLVGLAAVFVVGRVLSRNEQQNNNDDT